MQRLKYIVPVVMVVLAVNWPVRAGVLGGQIVQTSYFRLTAPDMSQVTDASSTVVQSGLPELGNFAAFIMVDFFDSTLIALRAALPSCCPEDFLLRFSDYNHTIPAIADVTIKTAYAGFTASALSVFGGDVIDVRLAGLSGRPSQVITLDLASLPAAAATVTGRLSKKGVQ